MRDSLVKGKRKQMTLPLDGDSVGSRDDSGNRSDYDLQPSPSIRPGWRAVLSDFLASEEGRILQETLSDEVAGGQTLYPPAGQVYRALESFDIPETKVVILGQDPYHGPGQAHGLAFSVASETRLPPSLRNIFGELYEDLGVERHSGDLSHWADQGVLLLNSALTVRESQAGAHSRIGWQVLTDELVRQVNQHAQPTVFLLWGKDAQAKQAWIDIKRHAVIATPHPSPLSAYRGFFGSRPFSRANAFLIDHGRKPIEW